MDPRPAWATGVALLLALSACNREETKATDQKLEANVASIQRNLVNRSCLGCHLQATASNRYVSLTDVSKLIEKPGHAHEPGPHQRMIIKPGCPKQSLFLSIMREGKMPPSAAERVPAETLKIVEEFITSLRPNEGKSCNDDEPPDDGPNPDEPVLTL